MTILVCAMMVGLCLWAVTARGGQEEGLIRTLPMGQMEERVASDTIFEQTIHYIDCNEDETIRGKAAEDVIGMTRDEVAALYREWQIESFGRDKVVLKLAVEGVCKQHRQEQFLGIRDNKVAIYYGKPTEKPILKEVIAIKVDSLVGQVREELQKGIPFHSEEERLRIMEGLEVR